MKHLLQNRWLVGLAAFAMTAASYAQFSNPADDVPAYHPSAPLKISGRHHILTTGVTLIHVAIAVATISIIKRGRRWPWHAALALGGVGALIAAFAYVG